jgi:GTP-binding protein Era
VERDSQKGILIGSKGQKLKQLGQSARSVIEAFLDRKVYLQLTVRVSTSWRKDEETLNRFGY